MSKSKRRRLDHQPRQTKPQQSPGIAHSLEKATAFHQRGQLAEAALWYRTVLKQAPDHFAALHLLGVVEAQRKNFELAVQLFRRALEVNPKSAAAHANLGVALRGLKQYQEALASYGRALEIQPEFAEALNNRGNALVDLRRHEEALDCFDRALALKPDYAEAVNSRATALRDLRRHEEATEAFDRLLNLAPDYDGGIGNRLHSKLHCCVWDDYDRDAARIVDAVAGGKRAVAPFAFLSISGSPSAQLQCARAYSSNKYPASRQPIWQGEHYRHDRIRVAYLSADFLGHAVSYLMAGLFEAHDRSRFDITAISFGPDDKDEMRTRLQNAFDRFLDVRSKSDREVALLLKELEIDIAVDLMGYTKDYRMGIFALRPAPIQVNYLGYPGTSGTEYIDYILADRFVIHEDEHAFYSEKVVYLPDTFHPRDFKRPISEYTPSRAEAGLPLSGFVFCSFNNNYKIAPPVFDVWMRLLHQVEGSVLWLLGDNAAAIRNLQRHAEARGVAPDRLVFAPRVKLDDHLARQRLADLFLDTLPYNAGTIASDALWAGLPLVTCVGSSFVGRMAGSVLMAAGLPELVTGSLAEYEALALGLARDTTRLAAIRARLAQNRASCPLFDTDRIRRHIESAYETMWQRHQRGDPPASFAVMEATAAEASLRPHTAV